jgi:simple sugar transport system substrate-binding protein
MPANAGWDLTERNSLPMKRSLIRCVVAVSAVTVVLGMAACSPGGKPKSSGSSGGGGGQVANNPRWKFAMISHAALGDAFFDTIIKGAKDAAAQDNVEFQYTGDNDVTKQAQLVQAAIDSKVDGIAVSIPNPKALMPTIQKAVAAGIPVIAYNAGDRDWQKSGALSFYGEPEVLSGQAAGAHLVKDGLKHALCVVQAQGQVQLEDRCSGMRESFTGGTVDEIFADGTDTSGYVSTIKAKLKADPSIDAVITLGPALGVAVANDLKGGKVKVATYAMTKDVYPKLLNGDIIFTIDQQPYLQGYMSINSLWLYKRNGNILGANLSIATGPLVIDKANAAQVQKYAEAATR